MAKNIVYFLSIIFLSLLYFFFEFFTNFDEWKKLALTVKNKFKNSDNKMVHQLLNYSVNDEYTINNNIAQYSSYIIVDNNESHYTSYRIETLIKLNSKYIKEFGGKENFKFFVKQFAHNSNDRAETIEIKTFEMPML